MDHDHIERRDIPDDVEDSNDLDLDSLLEAAHTPAVNPLDDEDHVEIVTPEVVKKVKATENPIPPPRQMAFATYLRDEDEEHGEGDILRESRFERARKRRKGRRPKVVRDPSSGDPDPKFIVYCGDMEVRKGFDLLVKKNGWSRSGLITAFMRAMNETFDSGDKPVTRRDISITIPLK